MTGTNDISGIYQQKTKNIDMSPNESKNETIMKNAYLKITKSKINLKTNLKNGKTT